MNDDILKDFNIEDIKKQMKTIEKVADAFAKLAEKTGREICDQVVKDCDGVVELLDKIIEGK